MCDAALLTFETNFIALQLSSLKRDEVQMMEKWKLPQKSKHPRSHICILSTYSSYCCTWFCTSLPEHHHHQNTQKVKKKTYFNQTIKDKALCSHSPPRSHQSNFIPITICLFVHCLKKGSTQQMCTVCFIVSDKLCFLVCFDAVSVFL